MRRTRKQPQPKEPAQQPAEPDLGGYVRFNYVTGGQHPEAGTSMDAFLGRKRDADGKVMLGDGKKKKTGGKSAASKLKAIIRKHKKRGMTMADLIKFLVTRRRKKKSSSKLAKQPPIVQPGSFGTFSSSIGTLTQKHGQKPEGHGGPLDDMLGIVPISQKEAKAAPPDATIVAVRKDAGAADGFQVIPYDVNFEHKAGDKLFLMPAGTKDLIDVTKQGHKIRKHVEEQKKAIEKEKGEKESHKKEADKAKKELETKRKAEEDEKKRMKKNENIRKIYENIKDQIKKNYRTPQPHNELKSWTAKYAKEQKIADWQAEMKHAFAADDFITYLLMKNHPEVTKMYNEAIKGLGIDKKELEGRGFFNQVINRRMPIEDLRGGMREQRAVITRDAFGMPKVRWELQEGGGKPIEPLTTSEIDSKMSHVPGFRGTIARDGEMKVPSAEPHGPISWVMNLDPEGEPGSHWVAVLITNRSVEYYDSFADPPDKDVLDKIVEVSKQVWPNNPRKVVKINRVPHQDTRTATCGYHAMKFIHDRLRGKSFPEATHFAAYEAEGGQVRKTEQAVREFAEKYPKFVQVGDGFLDPGRGDNMPYQIRRELERHGDEIIRTITVGRTPVQSLAKSAMNALSFGKLYKRMKSLNFDDLFHLFMVVTTDKGTSLYIEKNTTAQLRKGSIPRGAETVPVTRIPPNTRVKDLYRNSSRKGFWLYRASGGTNSPEGGNCQDHILELLTTIKAVTPRVRAFIKQDTEKLLSDLGPVAVPAANAITDIGGRVDGLKDRAIEAVDKVKDTAANVVDTVKDKARAVAEKAKKFLTGGGGSDFRLGRRLELVTS